MLVCLVLPHLALLDQRFKGREEDKGKNNDETRHGFYTRHKAGLSVKELTFSLEEKENSEIEESAKP